MAIAMAQVVVNQLILTQAISSSSLS